MYDQRFFASKLGLSALVSIAAMLAFNAFAFANGVGLSGQVEAAPLAVAAAVLA